MIIAAPTGVAEFDDADEALALTRHICVVIDREEIAVVVESRLLRIPHPARKHLKAAPIRLDAHDCAFVGKRKIPSLPRGHVHSFVADAPIDPAVGPDAKAVHVVPRIRNVNTETVRDHFTNIRHAVVVRILEAPQVRRDRRIDPAVVIHHTRGNPGDVGVKTFRKHRHLVRHAIAVRVAELVDALAEMREILPIDRPILVVIGQPAAGLAHFSGREHVAKKSRFLRDGAQPHIVRHPHPVLANIQIAHLAPGRGRHIDAPLRIDGHGDGIGHINRARPFFHLELFRRILVWGRGRRERRSERGAEADQRD